MTALTMLTMSCVVGDTAPGGGRIIFHTAVQRVLYAGSLKLHELEQAHPMTDVKAGTTLICGITPVPFIIVSSSAAAELRPSMLGVVRAAMRF